MSTDPRLQQLASEAAEKIKAVTSDRDGQIKRIYQNYREQATLIRAEVTSKDLARPTDDLRPEPHPQRHQKR